MEVNHPNQPHRDLRLKVDNLYLLNEVSTKYHNKYIKVKTIVSESCSYNMIKERFDTSLFCIGSKHNLKFNDINLGQFELTNIKTNVSDMKTVSYKFKPINVDKIGSVLNSFLYHLQVSAHPGRS